MQTTSVTLIPPTMSLHTAAPLCPDRCSPGLRLCRACPRTMRSSWAAMRRRWHITQFIQERGLGFAETKR